MQPPYHRIKVVIDDRAETDFGLGDAYAIEPRHDAWVAGIEPLVGVDVSAESVGTFAKEEKQLKRRPSGP